MQRGIKVAVVLCLLFVLPFADVSHLVTVNNAEDLSLGHNTSNPSSGGASRALGFNGSRSFVNYSGVEELLNLPIVSIEAEESIVDADVSGDGRYVAFIDGYKVKVLDVGTGEIVSTYTSPSAEYYFDDIAVSNNSIVAAVSDYDKILVIIDMNSGGAIIVENIPTDISADFVDISDDGSYIVVGGYGIACYKLGAGLLWTNETISMDRLFVSGDGSKVIAVIMDDSMYVLDSLDGSLIHYNETLVICYDVDVDYDGDVLFSTGESIVFVSHTDYGSSIEMEIEEVNGISISDYNDICAAATNESIVIVDMPDNVVIKKIYGAPEENWFFEMSSDGQRVSYPLYSADVVMAYDILQGKTYYLGHTDAASLPDFFDASANCEVAVVGDEVRMDVLVLNYSKSHIYWHGTWESSIESDVSDDLRYLATASDYSLRLYDMTKTDPLEMKIYYPAEIVSISPSGEYVAYGYYEELYVYNKYGDLVFSTTYSDDIDVLKLTNDELIVGLANGGGFYIYSLPDFSLVLHGDIPRIDFIYVSENNKYVAMSGYGSVVVVDLDTYRVIRTYEMNSSYVDVAVSSDGLLAIGDAQGTMVMLINITNNETLWSIHMPCYIDDIDLVDTTGDVVVASSSEVYYLKHEDGSIAWCYNVTFLNYPWGLMIDVSENGSFIFVITCAKYVVVVNTIEMKAYCIYRSFCDYDHIKEIDSKYIFLEGPDLYPILLINPFSAIDEYPPIISIRSPSNGSTVYGNVQIVAEAYDASGIQRVDFYVNGSLLCSDYDYPYYAIWNTRDYDDGYYNITIVAYDNSPNRNSASYSIIVLLNNSLVTLFVEGPSDFVTYLYDESQITWTIDSSNPGTYWVYCDSKQIDSGSFSPGTTNITVPVNTSDIGTFNYTLLVIDDEGYRATHTVIVTVEIGIEIYGVQNNSQVLGAISLQVSFLGSWSPQKVEFYINDTLMYTDEYPPWEWTWEDPLAQRALYIIGIRGIGSDGRYKSAILKIYYVPSPWGDFDGDGIPNYLEISGVSVSTFLQTFSIPFTSISATLRIRKISFDSTDGKIAMFSYLKSWGAEINVSEESLAFLLIVEIFNVTKFVMEILETLGLDTAYVYYLAPYICSDDNLRFYLAVRSDIDALDWITLLADSLKSVIDPTNLIDSMLDFVDMLSEIDVESGVLVDGGKYIVDYVVFNFVEFMHDIISISTIVLALAKIIATLAKVFMEGGPIILASISVLITIIQYFLGVDNVILDFASLIVSLIDPPDTYLNIVVENASGELISATEENNATASEYGIAIIDSTFGLIITRSTLGQATLRMWVSSPTNQQLKFSIIALESQNCTLSGGAGYAETNTNYTFTIVSNNNILALECYKIRIISIPDQVECGEDITIRLEVYLGDTQVTNVDVYAMINETYLYKFEVTNSQYQVTVPTTRPGVLIFYIYTEAPSDVLPSIYHKIIRVNESTLPTLTIVSPINNSYINQNIITISWLASDNYGIDHYEIYIDGQPYSINIPNYTTSCIVALSEGTHIINVKAINIGGNVATKTIIIHVDLTAPTVSITNISRGNYTSPNVIIIMWTAEDNYYIDHFKLYIDGKIVDPYISSNKTSYTLALAEGTHTITLEAIDAAGNIASASVRVHIREETTEQMEEVPRVLLVIMIIAATITLVASVFALLIYRSLGKQ